jgi:hypothetical protein
MHVQPTRRCRGSEAPKIEVAVLMLLLALHPAHLTFAELMLEIGTGPERRGATATVEQAVGALVASGLLHRHGDFLLPTRAALRCDQLLG